MFLNTFDFNLLIWCNNLYFFVLKALSFIECRKMQVFNILALNLHDQGYNDAVASDDILFIILARLEN
jgi:hypothetical protein